MARRPSRRRTPWPRLGKPIEGFPRHESDPQWEQWTDELITKWQYQRMLKIKKHYGIEGVSGSSWYQLALAVASELDDGLKVVDYKPPRIRSWKGASGYKLVQEVRALKETTNLRTDRDCLRYIKAEQTDYKDISLPELVVRYAEAKKHHLPAKKLRTWDGRTITRR